MKRSVKRALAASAAVLATLGAVVGVQAHRTEAAIDRFAAQVAEIGRAVPAPAYDEARLAALPAPVRRYLRFALGDSADRRRYVALEMRGLFRRPGTEIFAETTATQTIAVGVPALVFAATTPVAPGVWARAYDFYADGQMEMKAKILSTLTVVDERETPALNRTSLRRWLLESPLYPMALAPGGPVRWEPIDAVRARAIVEADGLSASLVAVFRADGALERFEAEEDGDLSTPYHGSGEVALRDDYRPVDGMMIPHRFTIARAAGGEIFPFWRGEVTGIRFDAALP
ncbi:MAG: hypothetical protein NXI21_02765 [Alphaproteobacteria bacterium]|nr:hypothetical protein [Alphaproteobacteria bacterium]